MKIESVTDRGGNQCGVRRSDGGAGHSREVLLLVSGLRARLAGALRGRRLREPPAVLEPAARRRREYFESFGFDRRGDQPGGGRWLAGCAASQSLAVGEARCGLFSGRREPEPARDGLRRRRGRRGGYAGNQGGHFESHAPGVGRRRVGEPEAVSVVRQYSGRVRSSRSDPLSGPMHAGGRPSDRGRGNLRCGDRDILARQSGGPAVRLRAAGGVGISKDDGEIRFDERRDERHEGCA